MFEVGDKVCKKNGNKFLLTGGLFICTVRSVNSEDEKVLLEENDIYYSFRELKLVSGPKVIELNRWYKPEEIHPREFDGHDVEIITPYEGVNKIEGYLYSEIFDSKIVIIRSVKKKKKKVKVEKVAYVIFNSEDNIIGVREDEKQAKSALKWVSPGSYYVEMKGEVEIEVEDE